MPAFKNLSDDIQLQERDLAILQGLFESRIMTATHISALYFDGKAEATKKRLQKIKAAGLIGERKRRVNEKAVLFLTRKGFALLGREGILNQFPQLSALTFEKRANVSELTIRHELEVMDVKAALHSAIAKAENLSVAESSTWPLLHQFEARRPGYKHSEVLVKPDGFIRLHENEKNGGVLEHTFFLEVDRSSETQDTLVNRAGCYLDYYQSGGFAIRNGAARSAYKEFPFRVLIVLKSAERRNNTAERLLQNNPPILTQAYLSTFAEIVGDPLGPIWIRPIDYRNAQAGGPIANGERPKIYRRQSARLAAIEGTIKKVPLLEGEEEEK